MTARKAPFSQEHCRSSCLSAMIACLVRRRSDGGTCHMGTWCRLCRPTCCQFDEESVRSRCCPHAGCRLPSLSGGAESCHAPASAGRPLRSALSKGRAHGRHRTRRGRRAGTRPRPAAASTGGARWPEPSRKGSRQEGKPLERTPCPVTRNAAPRQEMAPRLVRSQLPGRRTRAPHPTVRAGNPGPSRPRVQCPLRPHLVPTDPSSHALRSFRNGASASSTESCARAATNPEPDKTVLASAARGRDVDAGSGVGVWSGGVDAVQVSFKALPPSLFPGRSASRPPPGIFLPSAVGSPGHCASGRWPPGRPFPPRRPSGCGRSSRSRPCRWW